MNKRPVSPAVMAKWIKRVLLCVAWVFLLWHAGGSVLKYRISEGSRWACGEWFWLRTTVDSIFASLFLLLLFGGVAFIFHLTRRKREKNG